MYNLLPRSLPPRISSCAAAALMLFSVSAAYGGEHQLTFNGDIRPILSENCFQCHGPDGAARQAELRLDLAESAQRVVAPGDPRNSELIRRITAEDPTERMPPAASHKRLTPQQQDLLVQWVQQGAQYQAHWSLIRPQRPPLPRVARSQWANNAVDLFVLKRLEEAGLEPSAACDKVTFIRRVTLDLTGLPPAPEEVDRFLDDDRAGAEERLIDRLMNSPRYGEHMASFWLEAARYADTDGYQNDRYRYMHAWRDWLVMALNRHQPYDQFVVEQLAGDMLPNATLHQQIATGFCRNHRINSEDGSIPQEWHVENVVDRVDTLGTVFLGLTIACARCHDHKYDPVSQQEYYRLFAYFNNVPEWGVGPNNGNSPPFIQVPESWPLLATAEDRAIVPEPVQLRPARDEAGNGLKRPQAGDPQTVMVMHELDTPRPTYLLERGEYDQPNKSQVLSPGVPAAINAAVQAYPRNRLELAQWLVHADHPLTARVAVNRMWHQFFGTGLVETSENFGSQGKPPSHPELLDWLARELIDSRWDLQALQKKVLTSATYRQSARVSASLAERDPDNRLLARGPRFRLPAFVVRDQALLASGLLVETMGGPPVKPYMPADIWSSISNNKYEQDQGASLYRRSIYTYWRRTIPPPTMLSFNAAAREVCSVRTDRTNTSLQALTLMNNVAFVEAARFLAERMLREGGCHAEDQLRFGFRLLTARLPRSEELSALVTAHAQFLNRFGERPAAALELLATGESPRDESLDALEHAAMTMTASLMLNLDETITKP